MGTVFCSAQFNKPSLRIYHQPVEPHFLLRAGFFSLSVTFHVVFFLDFDHIGHALTFEFSYCSLKRSRVSNSWFPFIFLFYLNMFFRAAFPDQPDVCAAQLDSLFSVCSLKTRVSTVAWVLFVSAAPPPRQHGKPRHSERMPLSAVLPRVLCSRND